MLKWNLGLPKLNNKIILFLEKNNEISTRRGCFHLEVNEQITDKTQNIFQKNKLQDHLIIFSIHLIIA